jgi:hypothetical protein
MEKKQVRESTGTGSSGHFKVPIVLAPQPWTKDQLEPFTDSVYDYTNAELAYEESDGDYLESKEKRNKIESNTKKMSKVNQYLKKFYTSHSDDEGNAINESEDIVYENLIKEDLRVWFGTKKKPKGSSQPKGPWVNICRKKEGGGHPPCGRDKSTDKGYPKCRAVGVAAKMTDSQKKSACSQKRTAEKSHNKSGTGNKPKMVSYKPKKNESVDILIKKIIKEILDS